MKRKIAGLIMAMMAVVLMGCPDPLTPTSEDTVPAAPTGLQAVAGDGQVTLSWTAVSNASSYRIYYKADATTVTVNDSLATSVTFNGASALVILPYGSYAFIVVAVNSAGASSPSEAVSAILADPLQTNYLTMIPDLNLRAAIKDTLAASYSITKEWGKITQADLHKITTLVAIAKNIVLLDGIDLCSNIQILRLVANSIVDITPVAGLNALVDCTFRDNKITTIAPLKDLSHPEIVEFLGVMGNSVSWSDWSAVVSPSKFTKLHGFSVSGTTADGLTTLFTNAQLETFLASQPSGGLEDFQISRFPDLDDPAFASFFETYISENSLTLLGMYLIDCSLTDTFLAKIPTLPNLQYLNLSENPGITNLSTLAPVLKASSFTTLNVSSTNLINLQDLETAYDAGGFHQSGASINITYCGLDLKTGSGDRSIVDYLVGKGVAVSYEAGNSLD